MHLEAFIEYVQKEGLDVGVPGQGNTGKGYGKNKGSKGGVKKGGSKMSYDVNGKGGDGGGAKKGLGKNKGSHHGVAGPVIKGANRGK